MSENDTSPNNQSQPKELEFPEQLKARAREFFKKGAEVAYTLNFDYAIELYLDGIFVWPDALKEGHNPLREIALRRQASGGKKSGFSDSSKFKKLSGKTDKEALIKAEYLLSKDPANQGHMADMVKAAADGGFRQTAFWVAVLLFELNRQKAKPSVQTFILLRDTYIRLEDYVSALQACRQALQLKPGDDGLQSSMQDLSAQATMQHGKYDGDGDFRDSIKDRHEQTKLQSQEQLIQSTDQKENSITQAKQEYQTDPQVPGKINKLVAALCSTENPENETEAIEILEKAYADSRQFRYRQKSGEIAIKKLSRKVRAIQVKINKTNPDPAQLKELQTKLQIEAAELLKAELAYYKECVENYPTDMRFRFEYGRRLLQAKQYDQAIPLFQETRSDSRHRLASLNAIGRCFFYKEWYTDAIETFQQALEIIENEESPVAKEIRYNLGRAYEADEKIDEALSCYRKVAQIDYNYLDARDRVEALRKKQQGK